MASPPGMIDELDVLNIRTAMMASGLSLISHAEPTVHLLWSDPEMREMLLREIVWTEERTPGAIYLWGPRECLVGCHNFASRPLQMFVVAHEMGHHQANHQTDTIEWLRWIGRRKDEVRGLYEAHLMPRWRGSLWEVAADLIAVHVMAMVLGDQPDGAVTLAGEFIGDMIEIERS